MEHDTMEQMKRELPDGWEMKTLGEVALLNPKESMPKGTIAKKVAMEHVIPYQKVISNYIKVPFSSGTKFKNGDVLFARITPCLENGKTAQVTILKDDEIAFGSTEFIVLREKEDITINDYLYYVCWLPDLRMHAIKSMNGTSGRQRVQNSMFINFVFPLPPLPTQERIAHILGSFDALIANLRRQNQLLEKACQLEFSKRFVQPVKDYQRDNGDGKLPSGWEEKTLGEVAEIVSGGTPSTKKPEYWNGDILWCTPTDITKGTGNIFIDNTEKKITQEGLEKSSAKLLPIGTILYTSRATIGAIAINTQIITTNQGFKSFIVNEICNNYYLYYFLKINTNQLKQLANGTTFLEISKKAIMEYPIPIPPAPELDAFHSFASPLFASIQHNSQQIASLAKARDALLSPLLSGRLVV